MFRSFRFTFILALAAAATALAAAGGWRYARASAPVSGPIILISVDTLRADHLPAYGYHALKTPAFDALAADGVVFERAYAHAPLTLPSHATILTGRLPFETGVRDETSTVKPGERMLPQMLRDRGYSTAGIVSDDELDADSGIGQGFEFFERSDDAEAAAERWLGERGRSRAFLFLHIDDVRRGSPYDASIASADETVGRLIRYLKSHQLYDRSTIVLLSDHGEGLGDHGEQGHGLLLEDATIRVPLIVKQEGNDGAGRRVKDIVQLIDVAPTVLELVKAPRAGSLRGRSLKPLLDDSGSVPPAAVYSEALYAKQRFGWSALTATTDEHGRVVRLGGDTDTPGGDDAGPAVDPREKVQIVEKYRSAEALAADRQWADALALLAEVVRAEPAVTTVWSQLAEYASLLGRYDVALDAYRHVINLDSSSPRGYLGAAATLMKLQKPRDALLQAAIAADLASDPQALADAHELLARLAVARRDAEAAAAEAALAQQADPKRPMSAFIAGRLLADQGRYAEALEPLEGALAAARESHAQIAELHFVAGDAYTHVDRSHDAEAQFAAEIGDFPGNLRARAALAALYRADGRADAADRAIADMTRDVPTPEAYQLAARLWTQSGNRRQADVVRAEARRAFAK